MVLVSIIPAFWRQRQEDGHKLQDNQVYIVSTGPANDCQTISERKKKKKKACRVTRERQETVHTAAAQGAVTSC